MSHLLLHCYQHFKLDCDKEVLLVLVLPLLQIHWQECWVNC
jgi:hypothetical protein